MRQCFKANIVAVFVVTTSFSHQEHNSFRFSMSPKSQLVVTMQLFRCHNVALSLSQCNFVVVTLQLCRCHNVALQLSQCSFVVVTMQLCRCHYVALSLSRGWKKIMSRAHTAHALLATSRTQKMCRMLVLKFAFRRVIDPFLSNQNDQNGCFSNPCGFDIFWNCTDCCNC